MGMREAGDTEEQIRQARRRYFDERLMPDGVRHAVLRSWMRCSEMGLRDRGEAALDPLADSVLAEQRERQRRLMELCRPELELLEADARDTGSIILLSDAEGLILDSIGDTGFASRAARVALRPGVVWSEAATGTNAIGLALAERRAASVHGAEHFFGTHAALSCNASPITDPRGAMMGVLDISGPAQVSPMHAMGLVRMAVEQIEHRMFRTAFGGCRTLRFHSDPSMLGSAREGILVFEGDMLVGANRRGLALLHRGWDSLDECRFEQLFGQPMGMGGPLSFSTPFGPMHGRWDRAGSDSAEALSSRTASLDELEHDMIRRALEMAGGNISAAARQLGVHRSTLHRRLKSAN